MRMDATLTTKYDCSATGSPEFAAAEDLSQTLQSWGVQPKYANYTIYFIVVVIFMRMLIRLMYFITDLRSLRTGNKSKAFTTSLYNRIAGICRYFSYRRLPATLTYYTGAPSSLGVLSILTVGFLYMLLWCFVPHFWYRACVEFGSPPLSVRAALMTDALVPFIYGLAGKVNVITLLTGVSYQSLNVFHRMVAWMSFFFALVHAIPFLVQPLWEGGSKFLAEQWELQNMFWSGTVALVALAILCLCSLKIIRDRYYEIFLHVHWPVGITYLALLFWHSGNTLTSWAFLWTSVAVLLVGYIYRLFRKTNYMRLNNRWLQTDRAILQTLPDNALEITVFSHTVGCWRPGQHFFLRFPSIDPIANHPFSVANSCTDVVRDDATGQLSCRMKYVVRPKTGTTKKMYDIAGAKQFGEPSYETTVLIDGPYGGLDNRSMYAFNNIVFIAGGSGVTAIMSFLMEIVAVTTAINIQTIHLIWVIRSRSSYEWFQQELEQVIEKARDVKIKVDVYVSKEMVVNDDDGCSDDTTEDEEKANRVFIYERPNVKQLLRNMSSTFDSGRNLVVTSGTASMNCDVGNAVADLQTLVIRGKVGEIYLHSEGFGW